MVFGLLKIYFRQIIKVLGAYIVLIIINKRRFLYTYLDLFKVRITSKNIISGFKKIGIWLFNFKIVLDNLEAIVEDEVLLATFFKAFILIYIVLDKLGNFIGIFQTF